MNKVRGNIADIAIGNDERCAVSTNLIADQKISAIALQLYFL